MKMRGDIYMKQLKVILTVLLMLLIIGCTNIDSPSKLEQYINKEKIDRVVKNFDLKILSDSDYVLYNLDLDSDYNGIRIRIYSLQDNKWTVACNQLWKLKSTKADMAIINNKDKGIVFSLKSKNMLRTEVVLDNFVNCNDYNIDYDVVQDAEINANIPIPIIACYRNHIGDNTFKRANVNDLQKKEIKLDNSDEYFIFTITLE